MKNLLHLLAHCIEKMELDYFRTLDSNFLKFSGHFHSLCFDFKTKRVR
jgi:hypothetical protein